MGIADALWSKLFLLVLCVVSVRVCRGLGILGNHHEGLAFYGHDVKGQNETVTDGECGVYCGDNKFKCASMAICVNGKCQCPFGFYGHPWFVCFPWFMWWTLIYGDPKMEAYNGETAHLHMPCRNDLTHVVTEHALGLAGGRCDVQVCTITHHLNRGYYLLGVDFILIATDFAHNRGRTGRKLSVRIYGHEQKDGKDQLTGRWQYKVQRTELNLATRTDRKHTGHLAYLNDLVTVRFDLQDNLAIIECWPCGVSLSFKAYVKYSDQLSGMIFSVRKDFEPVFPEFRSQLAGSPFNEGQSEMMTLKHELNLTKEEALMYISLGQQKEQNFGLNGLPCIMAIKEFNTMCRTELQKVFAIKVCAFIFINPNLSQCLKAGEFGENVASLFALCVQSMCLQHPTLCREVQKELEELNCEMTPLFKHMDCYDISRVLYSLYPQARDEWESITWHY